MVGIIKKGVRLLGLTLVWIPGVVICVWFWPLILMDFIYRPGQFEPEMQAYEEEMRLKRQQYRSQLKGRRRQLVRQQRREKEGFFNNPIR